MQYGGVGVGAADTAGDGHRRCAGKVGCNELHIVRSEAVEHGFLVRCFRQGDALHRLAGALPPVLAGQQAGTAALVIEIGAGAGGDVLLLCAGFQNGNVQQGRQGAVGPGESQGHGAASGGNALYVRQPGGVAGGTAGSRETGLYIGGGERRAVGKDGVLPQGQRAGQGLRVIGIGGAQQGLRLQLGIQMKQSLIEQGRHRLLHPVGAGKGVQGLARQIGQGKGGGQRGAGLLRDRFLFGREEGLLHLVDLGAAGQQGQSQRQSGGQGGDSVHRRSFREMAAACTPRRSPIFRWDQNSSGWQAVQMPESSVCAGASPARSSHWRFSPARST